MTYDVPTDIANLVVDPTAYGEWNRLQSAFATLRAENPVARLDPDGFDPFWAVTKFDDIRDVSRQNDIFGQGGLKLGLYNKEALKAAETARPNETMTTLDAPEHGKVRRITASWFLPGRIKALEPQLRALARRSVDEMLERGDACDFAEDIALRYPLRVILSILGIPQDEEETVLRLTQEVFQTKRDKSAEAGSPTNTAATQRFREYYEGLAMERRREPRDDLATVIAQGMIDESAIPLRLATSYYITVSTAGHDTTSSSLSGAIWGMCAYPDQFALLKEQPGLMGQAADEAVRWTTPVQSFMRTAMRDHELRGRAIRKGDWLMLCYPSGNRDEDVFEHPERFDVRRPQNTHVGFGYGGHMCLGMHLAKLELRLFLEELLPRVSRIELNGTPTRANNYFVGGPNYVPIRFKAA